MTELTPELLARHDGWLRALIARLVDGADTDDVVQEVWGSALRSPPVDGRALPAWLATVIGEPFATFHAVALALVLGGIWLAQRAPR